MKSFKEFLTEQITILNATDLGNLIPYIKQINSDTLIMDNPSKNMKELTSKLINWGYKPSKNDDSIIYKKNSSNIAITTNSGETKATIVVF